MKLVLKGFSQDVDLEGAETLSYLILVDEDSESIIRLPVHEQTIERLTQIVHGDTVGDEETAGFTERDDSDSSEAPQESEEEAPVEDKPIPPRKIPRPRTETEVKPL